MTTVPKPTPHEIKVKSERTSCSLLGARRRLDRQALRNAVEQLRVIPLSAEPEFRQRLADTLEAILDRLDHDD